MKRRNRLCGLYCLAAIAVLLLATLLPLLPTKRDAALYDGFLRLHVLANSDSEVDQTLKLRVRDTVLDTVCGLTADCTSAQDAAETLAAHKDRLVMAASATVQEEGFPYPVTVLLGEEYYPTREYEGMRLPAGVYRSLRVCIGEARGHNWWCVLFPSLCVRTAEPHPVLAEAGFTDSQIRILTDNDSPRYVLKFRILEWIGSLRK